MDIIWYYIFSTTISVSYMAGSKYEYVKDFEQHIQCLPQVYLVVRIDGKGFTNFTSAHSFAKPNDPKGLHLMNLAGQHVMEVFQDIYLAYGQSDEYSFVLGPKSQLYNRRSDKISSNDRVQKDRIC